MHLLQGERKKRHRFSLFTTIMTIVVLLLGNLVVATEAGDACGSDWPYCNGSLIPDFTDPLIVIEYTHRLVTGALGFVILFNLYVALKNRKSLRGERAVRFFAPASVVLLFAQAITGGLNVLLKTPPGFTTFDVMISLLLLVSLVFLTVALKREPVTQMTEALRQKQAKYRRFIVPSAVMLALYYLEVIVGAFFKHSAASEVLLGVHLSERLFDSFVLSQAIYYIHGILSLIVLVSALQILFYALREQIFVKSAFLLLALILAEIVNGLANVWLGLSVAASSLHMILAILTIVVGSYLVARAVLKDFLLIRTNEQSREQQTAVNL
ncbi:COX15/CtaA family protein [Brevibacillus marinus]|uniref:COX15/CtaA family protein n=1 Tax=Brevibacillus marinus TaxID=2496837 RepID=UPI000F82BE59|nr:COX15/CtaA family protein [Brevibacillus marinus]